MLRRFYFLCLFLLLMVLPSLAQTQPADIPCQLFPSDNLWNTRVDNLPLHPLSNRYINNIGATRTLHPDFGNGEWPPDSGNPIGIPYNVVSGSQPLVNIIYTAYGNESDPGPFPIPPNALREASSDHHVLVVDSDNCILYELFGASKNANGTWNAASGARYDLNSNALRQNGWTSADAAGLPVLPGLVRYEEILAGEINHAIRFTIPTTRDAYVWSARHEASSNRDPFVPPMGMRMRLKANFNISGYDPVTQIIFTAMKEYGIVLADNGSSIYISGVPDPRWDNDLLVPAFHSVEASDFEVVETCSLRVGANSGQAQANANPSGTGCLSANTGAIIGRVRDAITNQNLVNVNMHVLDENTSTVYNGCTDGSGNYRIYGLPLNHNYVVYHHATALGDCADDAYSTAHYLSVTRTPATRFTPQRTNPDFFNVNLTLYLAADPNQDGRISPTDAVYVLNRIGQTRSETNARADVNWDGSINSADVNLILGEL